MTPANPPSDASAIVGLIIFAPILIMVWAFAFLAIKFVWDEIRGK